MRILHTDGYFAHKATIPELTVDFCDDKDEDCKKKKLHVSLDAIGQKIDAFVAVATDAIIQVEKPWVISPTIRPELPTGYRQQIADAIIDVIGNLAAQMSGGDEAVYYGILMNMLEDQNNAYDFIRDQRDAIYALIEEEVNQRARETAKTLDDLVYDDIQESNWVDQADSFLHNFGKYDFAVIKTPEWVLGYQEKVEAQQVKEVQGTFLKHENIHPKNYFCSEDSTWDSPGTFEMDVSTVSMNDLLNSKDFDGFLPKKLIGFVSSSATLVGIGWLTTISQNQPMTSGEAMST